MTKYTDHQKKILVVDDNPANRKLAQELLKHLDVIPYCAASGEEALELTQDQAFDLILMDINMPGLSGQATTKTLRQRNNAFRIPIVALTAETVDDKKCDFLLADMDDFLCKPMSENDLKSTLERWLDPNKHTHTSPKTTPPASKKNSPQTSNFPSTIFSLNESLKLAKNLPDLAADMLNLLVESLTETKQKLELELSQGDLSALLETTHKFHGGCCYCGVPSLRARIKALELTLNKTPGDLSVIKELTESVFSEMDKLQAWADEHDIDALFHDV